MIETESKRTPRQESAIKGAIVLLRFCGHVNFVAGPLIGVGILIRSCADCGGSSEWRGIDAYKTGLDRALMFEGVCGYALLMVVAGLAEDLIAICKKPSGNV